MLIQSYGITKSADGVSAIDPGSVNVGLGLISYFSELGPSYAKYSGYTPSGAVHPIGAVNFARASYAKSCILSGGTASMCKAASLSKISYQGRTNSFSPDDQSELKRQLCAGNPVILKVPSLSNPSDPQKSHFVLAKGMTVAADGSIEYLAFDPAQIGNEADLTTNYGVGNIRGFRIYKQIADPSMISVHLKGGQNMVVTDPTGNRTGYNSITKSTYNSIPGATYTLPEAIDSPTSSNISTALESTFESLSAIDGQYKIEIFGANATNSSYQLTRYSFDLVGNINNISDKSGAIAGNTSQVITFQHSSKSVITNYAKLNVLKALFLDSVRKDKAFIAGKIFREDGRPIKTISSFVTIRLGNFVKSIDVKQLLKVKLNKETNYLYLDWGLKGLAFQFNADTGEFSLYFDNIELDDSKPLLATNIEIRIDDTSAENVVVFRGVKRRSNGK